MKLLDRREIDTLKAQERKREIDEGKKLAERVDTLREVAAAEQASLENFRVQTVSRLGEEIAALSAKKDALAQELIDLEEKCKYALEPVAQKRNELQVLSNKLELREHEILARETSQDMREEALEKREEALKNEEKRVFDERERSKQLLAEAKSSRDSTLQLQTEAQGIRDSTQRFKEALEQEFIHRDAELASRERECTLKEDFLARKEDGLRVLQIRLEDRESTLKKHIELYGQRVS